MPTPDEWARMPPPQRAQWQAWQQSMMQQQAMLAQQAAAQAQAARSSKSTSTAVWILVWVFVLGPLCLFLAFAGLMAIFAFLGAVGSH